MPRKPFTYRCEVYIGDTPWEQCTQEQRERVQERVARAFARVTLDRWERAGATKATAGD